MRRPTVDIDANLRRERFEVSGQIIKQACRQQKNVQTLVRRCDVCNFMKVSKIKQIVEQNGIGREGHTRYYLEWYLFGLQVVFCVFLRLLFLRYLLRGKQKCFVV